MAACQSHLIQYLIERWGYDYSSLLTDESRMEFKPPRPPAPYPSYHHSPPSAVPAYYYPPPAAHHYDAAHHTTTPFNSSTTFEGYPDRRYKLDPPHLVGGPLVYTAVVPAPYTPSADWWTRFSRSVDVSRESGEGVEQEERSSRPKRQSASANTQKLCPTSAQFIMPKAAMNNRGNWMYVVNLNEVSDRYTQLVRSETCVSSTCSGLCSLPNGYSSSCEQQYVQKRLVALDGSGDRLYTDVFWFPHCCVCQITQTG